MQITIRKATVEDCREICKVHVASIQELGKTHYSEKDIDFWSRGRTPKRYEMHILSKHVIVAQIQSIIAGFGTLDLFTGELVQLYIKPDHVRMGIGTLILNELIDVAKNKNFDTIHLKSSLNAQDFYKNAGFTPGEKCKNRMMSGGEIDCIPMRKVL